MVPIRRLDEDDWRLLRDVRLRALLDAPEAFASAHADEAAMTAAQWTARLRGGAWFVAWPEGAAEPCGLVGALPDGREWFAVAMWVAPGRRGSGLAGELIAAVVRGARRAGTSVVALQVNEHNSRARRLYEKLGFRPTGQIETLPREDGYTRERMSLALAHRAD
ncbi:GNAT family N-acetyltransferase [Amycolatopsis antarctica]|uniref:GNAT family N-acetyltransferase n=1 Tax=Amycolatopsis antarctica TaxID=1854586 RepID=A0A263D3H6_9PSEU|nr:GNAT family N-acetyltransferase [Amycolatopsis antarctica]OZM72769.1 GNAT family N-acetyltransferase [Amycolatopsis antarctica]